MSTSRGSRIGGLPTAGADFTWPDCRYHRTPMQFTAQFDLGDRLVLVFFCQQDPGLCDSWEADEGCNAVIVLSAEAAMTVATTPEGIRPAPLAPMTLETAPRIAEDGHDVDESVTADGWTPIGIWGGEPYWIQDDETPAGARFLAQLDETPLGINFADGYGYVFIGEDGESGKTLFQS